MAQGKTANRGNAAGGRRKEAGREDPPRATSTLAPVKKKIGESPDTLRRRAEWHRKRSGESG
ncbi:MAG: hypothetical protein LC791_12165 [Acidobacteria bacterium]|nr:hypothetical protein [Acidobacteriota bacterium]